ncbi:MAG: hypothetical protein A3K59_06050 [Euryarchaeota archaeon RBG_19FT_COMBO_69_17]|nr:MAG: hypothetical protein A3K59_06050 [Euryarchaeota archaeon RBG_19FT_COMBO_69_17]
MAASSGPGGSEKVLVIGAGIAGLACGDRLRRAGVDVEILEARDRVGGRVWTLHDFASGLPVEAGAVMVHGRDASLHAWIREFGLTTWKTPIATGSRIYHEGRLRAPIRIAFSSLRNFRGIVEILWSLPRAVERYEGPDRTLEAFLADRRGTPLGRRFVAKMFASVNAADPGDLSVLGLAEEANVSSLGLPWSNYRVLEGLDRIATRRAQGLGDRIRLRTRVERIDWSEDGARVESVGPDGRESRMARAAVVTLPLGVLKAGDVVFEPPLPPAKREAIEALGYGHANKVLLLFDASVRETALGRATSLSDEDGTWYFLPKRRPAEGPVAVEAFVAGRKARDLSSVPEAEAVGRILDDLGRMLGGIDLRPQLLASRYVDWSSDPYSKGAYTFPSPSGLMAVRRVLSEPIGTSLFFAGEATHSRGEYATIHGALESGVRAADEVLRALAEDPGRPAGGGPGPTI